MEFEQQVKIAGATITGDCVSTLVTSRENAIADALITANDLEGETFLNNADTNDLVEISYRLIGAASWELAFEGYVEELNPELNTGGEVCAVKCYGIGIPFSRMRVKGEYGTQSSNPTYKTVRGILAALDSKGVLYGYVNRIMGSAATSGYSIGCDYIDDNRKSVV